MKLLISESQLEILIAHINEGTQPKQVIEEGWKEVVLGVAMLLGVGLTGANAQTSDKALDDTEILNKIAKTLSGPDIEKLADTLEKGGLENAMDKIKGNAEEIKAKFEVEAKKKGVNPEIKIYNTNDAEKVRGKVKQDYAVSDIEITKDTIWTPQDTIELDSMVSLTFDANVFKTGTFDLDDDIRTEIEHSLKKILTVGGKINSIKIESSTDTEPIKMGNDELAYKRANSVKSFIDNMNIGVEISANDIKTIPNNGAKGNDSTVVNPYSTSMTPEERATTRNETSKYRYIKIIVDVTFERNPNNDERAFTVIEDIKYELVKIKSKSRNNTHRQPVFKIFKLSDCKVNKKRTSCPKF